MFSVLGNARYARLFAAQGIALTGTGLLTVALGLLAYNLAGESAGAVLGTALAIKMIAYVGFAPVAAALAERLARPSVLIGADLVRASVALFLPFVDAVWQVYVLIFVLQAASATFTPTFQATIPDILEDEADYTKALSLSRLAYDLENLLSPVAAGLLLTVMSYHWLFAGTVAGFAGSAVLVWVAAVPVRNTDVTRPFVERLTRGTRIYLATPRLRGLLALSLAAASAGAFVIVNTVVLVRDTHGGSDADFAIALGAFGLGSMLTAFALPKVLEHVGDRPTMISAAVLLTGLTLAHGVWWTLQGPLTWDAFLLLWAASGALSSAVLTPSGRLLRRSAHAEDRPAVFAAQFALSHACWLITYPAAGWIGIAYGLPTALLVLGGFAVAGIGLAILLWPAGDPIDIVHGHPDLPADHPHLAGAEKGSNRHAHPVVIDDLHPVWPRAG
ncbi:MAG: MFS transporter [Pseudomonadota bacterium]